MHKRYGGFWRYPGLLDFCYLVNPYYPPKKLKDELRASFDTLLTEYPSGMGVNSLLAAKNFGVHKDNIIVVKRCCPSTTSKHLSLLTMMYRS